MRQCTCPSFHEVLFLACLKQLKARCTYRPHCNARLLACSFLWPVRLHLSARKAIKHSISIFRKKSPSPGPLHLETCSDLPLPSVAQIKVRSKCAMDEGNLDNRCCFVAHFQQPDFKARMLIGVNDDTYSTLTENDHNDLAITETIYPLILYSLRGQHQRYQRY